MYKADYQDIIAEYKEQVRVLKEQNNETNRRNRKRKMSNV